MNKEIEQKSASFLPIHASNESHERMLEFARWLGERWAGKIEFTALDPDQFQWIPDARSAVKTCADLIREDLK